MILPVKGGEAICDATDIQFHIVIGILHIELPIEFCFSVFVNIGRDLCKITLAILMDACAAN